MDPFADLIPQKNTQGSSASSAPVPTPFDDLIPGRQVYNPTRPSTPAPEEKGSMVGEMARSLVTAPATILARPFQAIQATGQYIQDRPKIKEYERVSKEITADNELALKQFREAKARGLDTTPFKERITMNNTRLAAMGQDIAPTLDRKPTLFEGSKIVAPVPENMADVKKDVGRAIQTVALGTGAPIAGGAAFGLGSSLEQGNDLFSVDTLISTALGGAGGKAIDWVGKPLFNAAGKVVGTITPQILKDVAGKGASALAKFAQENQLLGGIAKPLSEKIATGFQAVDDKAGSLFKGTGSKFKDVISSQYPGLSKESLTNRYVNVEKGNFAKPTETPSASYRKATEIFNNAKEQGTDLADIAVKNGIRHDSLIEGGKYNTLDTADSLRADAMKTSRDLIRPALAAAEPGVERVPIKTIREEMISKIDSLPPTQITDAERELMKRRIATEYGDQSAAARAHPNGFSLTDLHDNSIAMNLKGKYKVNGTSSDEFKAKTAREAGATFRKLLEEKAPPELEVGKFKAELQKKFQLADYLESLNTKKVPMGIVQKAVDLFGKVAGASVGAQVGGGLGGVAGYHLGGVLFDAFEHLPNPVKARYLSQIAKETPEVFKAFQDYLGKQEVERLMRKQLPAPTTIFKGPTQNEMPYTPNRLFGTTPVVETKRIEQ